MPLRYRSGPSASSPPSWHVCYAGGHRFGRVNVTDNLDNTETGLARGEDGDSSPKPSDALCLRSGLRVEYLDDEAIVLDQDGQSIHRLQGESVAALRLVEQGLDPRDLADSLAGAVDELAHAGLLVRPRAWMQRRAFLAGGAAATAAAVTTFALADPAAAASSCPNTPTAPDPNSVGNRYPLAGTYTFWTGPADTSLFVRLWGAGGGGGGSSTGGTAGSGGGGGGYTEGNVTVAVCSSYSVVVGAGGAGGRQNGVPAQSGATGGTSSFDSLTAGGGGPGGYAGGTAGSGGPGHSTGPRA